MARKQYRKTPKGQSRKSTFFILLAVVIIATVICFKGVILPTPDGKQVKVAGASDIRFGIDIRGGVEAVYMPEEYEGKPTDEQLDAVRNIMETRLDNLGILDRDVIIDKSNGRVVVRFPWKSDDTTFDPDQAMQELGETAELTFKDPSGEVILTGADVKTAKAAVNQMTGENIVMLELLPQGATKFAEATERLVGQNISINMDEEMISIPGFKL